jgi:hypothetical protein
LKLGAHLVYKKSHVQHKVALYIRDGPSFFQKAGIKKLLPTFWLSELEDVHGACVDKTQKAN